MDEIEGWEVIFVLLPVEFCESKHLDVVVTNDRNEVIEARISRTQEPMKVEIPEDTPRMGRKLN